MPLVEIARTPRRPIPGRPPGTPYAFAVRVLDLDAPSPPATVVLCPWCAAEHPHTLGRTVRTQVGLLVGAPCGGGDYVVVTRSGTPVMVRG